MKNNIGACDQNARFSIGAIIMVLGAYYHSWWGILGLLIFVTALTRFCALYTIVGINTCPTHAHCAACPSCEVKEEQKEEQNKTS